MFLTLPELLQVCKIKLPPGLLCQNVVERLKLSSLWRFPQVGIQRYLSVYPEMSVRSVQLEENAGSMKTEYIVTNKYCDNAVFFLITDTDECSSNLCLNGGVCVDGVNGYTCRCLLGYEGGRCGTSKFVSCGHVAQRFGMSAFANTWSPAAVARVVFM